MTQGSEKDPVRIASVVNEAGTEPTGTEEVESHFLPDTWGGVFTFR